MGTFPTDNEIKEAMRFTIEQQKYKIAVLEDALNEERIARKKAETMIEAVKLVVGR